MILPLPCTVDNLQQNNDAQTLASLVCLRPSRFCRRPACLRPYYLRLRMSLRLTLLPSPTPPPVLVVLRDAFYTPASLHGHVSRLKLHIMRTTLHVLRQPSALCHALASPQPPRSSTHDHHTTPSRHPFLLLLKPSSRHLHNHLLPPSSRLRVLHATISR
jgi:hypothetical protein